MLEMTEVCWDIHQPVVRAWGARSLRGPLSSFTCEVTEEGIRHIPTRQKTESKTG